MAVFQAVVLSSRELDETTVSLILNQVCNRPVIVTHEHFTVQKDLIVTSSSLLPVCHRLPGALSAGAVQFHREERHPSLKPMFNPRPAASDPEL